MIDFKGYLYDMNLEYDDFDIPVEEEWCEDYWNYNSDEPDQHCGVNTGTLFRWIYHIYLSEDDYAEYLNKKAEDITEADLDGIDETDFYNFLLDKYRDDAYDDAEHNWETPLDDNDVIWDDPRAYEPEPDHEPDYDD